MLRRLLPLAVVVSLLLPSGAEAAGLERLTGTLRTVLTEVPGREGSEREFAVLELPNGRAVELRVSGNAALPPDGSRVTVSGRRSSSGAFVAAEGGTISSVPASEPAPTPTVGRRVAVLLVNFTTDARTPWTHDQVRASYFADGTSKSVRTYFREQSYGQMEIGGDVLGYYTIEADRSSCAWSTWHELARRAATASGVDLTAYTHIQAIWPTQTVCGWAGLAYVPGTVSALNGTISWTTAAHELGHNFNTHHAGSLSCSAGGAAVTLSDTCTAHEYGDPFSRMGGGAVHFNNIQRRHLAFLTTADQRTVTESGTYALGVASDATPDAARILRVRRADGTFLYVESRQTYGLFESFGTSTATGGVLLRIGPDTARTQTRLLDTVPSTTTFADAALTVGKAFTDPSAGATITTVAIGPEGATVRVTFGAPDPTAPAASPAPTAPTNPTAVPSATARPSTTVAPTTAPTTAPTPVPPTPVPPTPVPPSPKVTAAPTPTPDTQAPTAPTNLRAKITGGRTGVTLDWRPATDNRAVTGYLVLRDGAVVTTLPGSARAWVDNAAPGKHRWAVVAVDAAGNRSPSSNVATATVR